jgi:hypothetical protein
MSFRVLVCGGRDYGDLVSLNHDRTDPLWPQREKEYRHILDTLGKIFYERCPRIEPDEHGNYTYDGVIISGAARGADSVAIDFAVLEYLKFEEYPADWKKYGKRAGYIRNVQMLEEGKPDLVVAFPGGKGTQMMKELARKAGITVIEVD